MAQCPPRPNAPADWCKPHDHRGVPGQPTNTFITPETGGAQQTYPPQQPPVGSGAMPVPPPPMWGASPQAYPVIPTPNPYLPPVYSANCVYDGNGDFCTVQDSSPIASGTSCSCSGYPGSTQ